jgi:hypothetical protein
VADIADRGLRETLVLLGRLRMHVVARQTRQLMFSKQCDITRIHKDVFVARIQFLQLVVGPINIKVSKQIVTSYEIVRVRRLCAARLAAPEVTLTADRNHLPRLTIVFRK